MAKGASEVVLDVGDDDLGTVAKEEPRGGFADAAGSTGNECYLAF